MRHAHELFSYPSFLGVWPRQAINDSARFVKFRHNNCALQYRDRDAASALLVFWANAVLGGLFYRVEGAGFANIGRNASKTRKLPTWLMRC